MVTLNLKKENLGLLIPSIVILLLVILMLIGTWHAHTISAEGGGMSMEATIMYRIGDMKVDGLGVEATMDYDSEPGYENMGDFMGTMRILTLLVLVLALGLLAMAAMQALGKEVPHRDNLTLVMAIGVAAMALISGLIFMVQWPGAMDDDGYYDEFDMDKAFWSTESNETSGVKQENKIGPGLAWISSTIIIPIMGGVAAFFAFKLKKAGPAPTDPAAVAAVGAAPEAYPGYDQQQMAAQQYQQQQVAAQQQAAQQPVQQQYPIVVVACAHCQQQMQAYSTGQPQVLQCAYCQGQFQVTV